MSRTRRNLLSITVIFLTVILGTVSAAKGQNGNSACSTRDSSFSTGTIAFISDRDAAQQIYLMDTSGNSVRRLTDFEESALSDLEWSPDGAQIAFVNLGDIYTISIENLRIAQLTTNPGEDYTPAWSPDGRYIAYITDRGGPYDIWVMRRNGLNIRALTGDPRWELTVEWTPDGSGIAYVPNSGADLEIWLEAWNSSFTWDGPFLFDRPDDRVFYSVTDLDWSPNGDRIALQTHYGAYIVNVDDAALREIESRETFVYSGAPSWAPDSCELVFASSRDGNPEIYILSLSDETISRLTDNAFNDYGAVWQPVSEQ